MMSMLCNYCVRELLILARTCFAFGLPSKTGCDIFLVDWSSPILDHLLCNRVYATHISQKIEMFLK
jgi:hypothetical protein